jgi:hypothetical protein
MRALFCSAGVLLFLVATSCAGIGSTPRSEPPAPTTGKAPPAPHALDPQQAERIKRIVGALVAVMDHPRPLSQIRVGIMDDPRVNAASGGGGEFYVTTGLLTLTWLLQTAGASGGGMLASHPGCRSGSRSVEEALGGRL